MLGREQQVQIVTKVMAGSTASKMEVLVISSSRGMGKTFFMKKLSRLRGGPLAPARNLGRIVSIECDAASKVLICDEKYHNNCYFAFMRMLISLAFFVFLHA